MDFLGKRAKVTTLGAGADRLAGTFLRSDRVPRLTGVQAAIVAGLAVFALLGWQGVSTAGRSGGLDSGEYRLNAQYLDAHGRLPPDYVSYEYSAPPLFEGLAVAAERVVRRTPSWRVELPWNAGTRLLWLGVALLSLACLRSPRHRLRAAGLFGALGGVAWGLDEAVQLGKTEAWSSGQMIALVCAGALVVVSALIARELWPGHPRRVVATAGFVAAYPVVLGLGVLFHPETTMALLSSLVVLLIIRAERRGWPRGLGAAVGVICGLDLLTRQSAIVVFFCTVVAAVAMGGRRAYAFTTVMSIAVLLVAGPWLVYAYHAWGNPFQGNLQRSGDMIAGGEPLSFYASFPIASLVEHPYRPFFANQLLPQLHADLWSDWFGEFHPFLNSPSRLDRVTASTQSVLGLVGDFLGLVGLAAFGVPALARVVRRRRGGANDFAFAFLAFLALTAFAALTLQISRFPQIGGKEIKASYLLFTAPCWAVFSVVLWCAVRRRSAKAHAVLVCAAALYVLSYGADLAVAFTHRYDPDLMPAARFGFVDLRTSIQAFDAALLRGQTTDYIVTVENVGTATAGDVQLEIRLAAGMRLTGPPYFERGSGCTGARTLNCALDFLPAGMTTPIRFSVRVSRLGRETVTASVSSYGIDAHPADNNASTSINVIG